MSIEGPETLTVTCDGDDCSESIDLETTEYSDGHGGAGGVFGISLETLEAAGWTQEGDETFCPTCTYNYNN